MSEAHEDGTPHSVRLGLKLLFYSVGGVALAIAITFLPPVRDVLAGDTTLTIQATTESVSWQVEATPDNPYVLPLPPGIFVRQSLDENLDPVRSDTSAPTPAVKVESAVLFNLISRENCKLSVTFQPTGRSVARISFYNGATDLQLDRVTTFISGPANQAECKTSKPVDILIENTSTLRLGEAVSARVLTDDYMPSPVVLSGKAVAFNRAALYGTRFSIGENEFNRGDHIELAPPDGATIRGVITFDPRSSDPSDAALDVVAHATNATAKIVRFGGGYEFKATTWLAIASQPIIQFFFSTLVAVLAVITFVMGVKKWRRPLPPAPAAPLTSTNTSPQTP